VSSELAEGVFVIRNMMLTPKNYHFAVGSVGKLFQPMVIACAWDFAILHVLRAI